MKSPASLASILPLLFAAHTAPASSPETPAGFASNLVISSTAAPPPGGLLPMAAEDLPEALTAPLAAEGASSELFIPIVLSLGGVPPSVYTSELTLANRGALPAQVELGYTAAFGGGSGSASTTVPAEQQKMVGDAIEYLRTLGVPIPDSGSRGGTLRVKFSGLSSPADGFASVRTTTRVSDGSAGLAYSGTNARALPVVDPAPDTYLGSGPWKATDYEPGDPFPALAPASPRASSSSARRGASGSRAPAPAMPQALPRHPTRPRSRSPGCRARS